MRLVKKDTITSEQYVRDDSSKGRTGGMSNKAIIGTLLGAAAGAAVAYAMVRSESSERITAPSFSRRASYGGSGSNYTLPAERVVDRLPKSTKSHVCSRDSRSEVRPGLI